MTIKIPVFDGIVNNASPLALKDSVCVDCSNVLVTNPRGAIDNSIGMSKYNLRSAGNPVVAIHQLKKHGWTSVEDTLFCLEGDSWFWDWDINFWDSNFSIGSIDLGSSSPFYDSVNDYLYYHHLNTPTITKCKTDNSDITNLTLPYVGTGYSTPYFDSNTNYIYTGLNSIPSRLIKTDITGSDFTVLSTDLSSPYGLDYDSSTGFIFIADYGNSRIVKIKNDGTNQSVYGSYGLSGTGKFQYPLSVSYDSNTSFIYVSDRFSGKIYKTKINGDGWETFGSWGSGINQFFSWIFLDYDINSGYLYISDNGNDRIVKTKFDGTGWQTYNITDPLSINYDSYSNYLFINSNNSIVILNESYAFP